MRSGKIARSKSTRSVARSGTSVARRSPKATRKLEKETIRLTVNGNPMAEDRKET